MSDEVSLRCTNREVFNLAFANADIREPVHPYQLQWVAHWSQASNSSSFQSHKHSAFANVIKNKIEEHCYLPVDTMKPSYTYEFKNNVTYDVGKHDSASYVLQTAKTHGSDNGRFSMINNPVIRNNLDSFCSEPKLPVSSMNLENFTSYQFQNSTGLRSEWTHFPMIEIKRKMESIVAPKKRTRFNTTEGKMNEVLALCDSPIAHWSTQFASEGHQHQQDITGTYKETSQHESEEGVPHYNCHRPKVTSSVLNYKENDLYSSGLAFKEHFANANLSYFKQGLCNSTKNSTITVSEMKNNNLRYSGISTSSLKNGSSSCPDDVPHPFLAEEYSKQRETVFGRNKSVLGLSEPNKMSNCSTIGCRKRESQKFSNATQYSLITKEVGANLCHNDQIVEGSSVSAKVKGTAFFEKLTLPTMLHDHGQLEENLQSLVSSTNDIEAVDGTDAQFMVKENENLVETDIKHIDVNEPLSSPEVGNSSESRKVPQEDVNPNTKSSEVEDSNSSRTESEDVLSTKPSNPPTESTERDSDPSSKWVKRLRPNSLDSIPLSTKRFKKGNSSSSEMQTLLSRVVNYNRTICDLPEPSRDSEKEIPWIRRWCKRSTSKETTSRKETPVLIEPENSKVISENFEARQFPSLAAMALMGKQVTNYRPCKFRKRGSMTVWNI